MLEKLFLEMISYYSGDPKRIQHFTKVHSYAKLIGEREQLSPEELYILEAAAYTHDIGIKPAEEKYGSSAGKLQEQEGPAVARGMLMRLGFAENVIERVCYLIGHHHLHRHRGQRLSDSGGGGFSGEFVRGRQTGRRRRVYAG